MSRAFRGPVKRGIIIIIILFIFILLGAAPPLLHERSRSGPLPVCLSVWPIKEQQQQQRWSTHILYSEAQTRTSAAKWFSGHQPPQNTHRVSRAINKITSLSSRHMVKCKYIPTFREPRVRRQKYNSEITQLDLWLNGFALQYVERISL